MTAMTFWQRTISIFKTKSVRFELSQGRHVIGELESIGETSCTVIKADGSLVIVDYSEIMSLEPAVSKL
jgi:hypothetical protein